ncbi:MAG: class I SAM-dependent methyltransferase [Candidatus Latescibacterota bacterium]|nr:MAG: class I SAM-dependent methyltransferase [Candidatus Latescibacterota bacterium]
MSTHFLESMYKKQTLISAVHRRRLEKIRATFDEVIPPSASSWGDFGCSTGFIIDHLVSRCRLSFSKIVGYDVCDELLEDASRRGIPNAEFRHFDLNELREPDGTFDVVSCFETLEHVADYRVALENLYRHQAPGGMLILTIPNETGLIGLGKFLGRFVATRSPYGDFFERQSRLKYISYLITHKTISGFREYRKTGYGPHLGFDYRDVVAFIEDRYVAKNKLTPTKIRSASWGTGKILINRRVGGSV